MSADGPTATNRATKAGGEYHPPPNANDDPRATRLRELVGLDWPSGTPYPPNATEPWLLGCRADALVVAFRLDPERLSRAVETRMRLAEETAGPVELALGPASVALRGTLDWRATGGWHLELVARAAFLATHPLTQVIDHCSVVARSFAPVVDGPRLRRVDLAADFMQFSIDASDRHRLATTRAHVTEFSTTAKDLDAVGSLGDTVDVRTHSNAVHRITGFTIAPGNPVSARIYDKTAELRCPGRDEKRAIEHGIWEARGWKGQGSVTRVEFQLRNVFLDDVQLRDADGLPAKLDGLWQLCVKWLRMIVPDSATRRSRCALDPRWAAVTAVVFDHEASPIARARKRGGASARHAFGTVLSFAASSRRLERHDCGHDLDGVVLDEVAFVNRMNDAQAHHYLERVIKRTLDGAGREIAASLVADCGPRQALLLVISRTNAAAARFSSVDDRGPR